MAARLLIYHMDEGKMQALCALCGVLGIEPVAVEESSHRAPIGLISRTVDLRMLAQGMPRAGMEAPDEDQAGPLDEEMIVMSGFSEEQFNQLLDTLRSSGLRVSLKAVETPSNRLWSGQALQAELKREREAFRRGR